MLSREQLQENINEAVLACSAAWYSVMIIHRAHCGGAHNEEELYAARANYDKAIITLHWAKRDFKELGE
jgi:hypothetical protein